jgi:hypothetical protein
MLTSSDIERASHCTFQPQSGRYFDRCRATATLIEKSRGSNHTWRQKRCEKHAARLVKNHETLVASLRAAVATRALSDVDQPIVERLLKAYSGE